MTVSNASFTTNYLGLLHDSIGIIEGLMTTVPACTDTPATVESPDDYGTAQNIITKSTGTANASVKVIQELIGKIIGTTYAYMPTHKYASWISPDMGRVKKAGKFDYIKKMVKRASESPQRGILSYNEDQVVSKNFNSKS